MTYVLAKSRSTMNQTANCIITALLALRAMDATADESRVKAADKTTNRVVTVMNT